MTDWEFYENKIKPKLDRIADWAKNGYTLNVIACLLQMSVRELKAYIKEYEELRFVIEDARAEGVVEVRQALYKLAVGYVSEETTTITREQGVNVVTTTETKRKEVGPNISAIQTYLRLYDDEYSDSDRHTRLVHNRDYLLKKEKQTTEQNTW